MRLRDNIQWLKGLSKGFRLYLVLNILLGVAAVGLSLLFIWLSKSLIDRAVGGTLEGGVLKPAFLIGAVLLAQLMCSVIRSRLESYSTTKMMNALRERLFYRVMLSKWRGREKYHTGDITTRLDGDVRKVAEALNTSVCSLAITLVEFTFSFVFMLSLDSRLAWLLFVIMPIALLTSKSYVLRLRSLTHAIRDVDSSVQAHIQEQVQHRSLISSMGHISGSIESLHRLSVQLFDKTMNRTNYTLFSRAVVRLGFSVGYLTAFLWGVQGLSEGTVTFGVMTAFLQLVAKVQVPVVEVSTRVSGLAQAMSSVERLAELDALDTESEEQKPALKGAVGLRAEGLVFSYEDNSRRVINSFSYDFSPNKLHVIVGETGSGKSTLLRLMLGFLSARGGELVLYNGCVEQVCSSATRSNFVYVPQGNTLISGTVRDNLLLAKPSATDSELRDVLYVAAAEFVYSLPEGLDTLCGERGAGLSEGEAQRIAIARGLLREGGVMLFDEPSSALDSHTEDLLISRLSDYAKNRTVIMVTHRESVTLNCSSIVKFKRTINE